MSSNIPLKMKAAIQYGPKQVGIEMVDVPQIKDDEVLIRVKNIGICPSDVRSYVAADKRQWYPYGTEGYGLSGHEWSGEVVKIGKDVNGIKLYDKVVPEIIIPCGTCKYCRQGYTNLCIHKSYISRGYAEYAVAPSKYLYKLPPNVSFSEAAFTEPLAVVLHTNDVVAPRPGETVLIVGAGPMGLLHLMISKLSGASIIMSEINESRLKIAKELGADILVNPASEDLSKVVKENTEDGVDAAIVTVGNKAAIESVFPVVSRRARIVIFAGTYPQSKIEIDPNLIHYGELKLTGSYDHMPENMTRALQLMDKKMVNLEKIITHKLPLERLNEGFELVLNAKSLKVQITP